MRQVYTEEGWKKLSPAELMAELAGNPSMNGEPWAEVTRRLEHLEKREKTLVLIANGEVEPLRIEALMEAARVGLED